MDSDAPASGSYPHVPPLFVNKAHCRACDQRFEGQDTDLDRAEVKLVHRVTTHRCPVQITSGHRATLTHGRLLHRGDPDLDGALRSAGVFSVRLYIEHRRYTGEEEW